MKTLVLLLSSAVLFGCSEKPASVEIQQLPVKQEQALTFQQRLERDAPQGDAEAQLNMGSQYLFGMKDANIEKNDNKAFEWFQKSAQQGNVLAQGALGTMYSSGRGTPKDGAKALEWWEKGASQGNADSQLKAALAYANGWGVPKNAFKAVEWAQQSASQGNALAQELLAVLYLNGTGVPKDDAKAAEWSEKAAMQGITTSQLRLGGMYGVGKGVPKDEVRAYAWINVAAAQGEDEVLEAREIIEKQMTPEQKAEAQKLSADLFSKIKKPKQ